MLLSKKALISPLLLQLLLVLLASTAQANILQNRARMGVRLNADMGLDSQWRVLQAQNAGLYGGGLQSFWDDVIGNQQAQGVESESVAGMDASLRRQFNGRSEVASEADAACTPEGAVITNRLHGGNLIRSLAGNDINRFSKSRARMGGFNHAFSEF